MVSVEHGVWNERTVLLAHAALVRHAVCVAENGVEGCDHLPHHSDDDDLGLLAAARRLWKVLRAGLYRQSAERLPCRGRCGPAFAPVDAAMSPELTAVEVIGCEADKGGESACGSSGRVLAAKR